MTRKDFLKQAGLAGSSVLILNGCNLFAAKEGKEEVFAVAEQIVKVDGTKQVFGEAHKSTKTTIPFLKVPGYMHPKLNQIPLKEDNLKPKEELSIIIFLHSNNEKYRCNITIFLSIFIL